MTTPLQQSIEIWRSRACDPNTTTTNALNCPLCEAHPDCMDCPIAKHTGYDNCNHTPYRDWRINGQTQEKAVGMYEFLKELEENVD